MATAGLGPSILLIAIAAAHILEETLRDFRGFFNTEWLAGTADCPVGRLKGLFVDKIGLLLVIAATALLGALSDGRWILVTIGIVTADCLQHAAFSIGKRGYTPGVATCVLYAACLAVFLRRVAVPDHPLAWLALLAGAGFIAGNYLLAWNTVRLGRCRDR
jgi:uncharacterized BrkB/YihY/UPF0761 family membrane protein